MSRKILTFLGKGGDAKTSSACALAEALARQTGGASLIVDLDSQGSVTAWLHGHPLPPVGTAEYLKGEVDFGDVRQQVENRAEDATGGQVDYLPLGVKGGLSDLDPVSLGPAMVRLLADVESYGYEFVFLDVAAFQPMGERATLHLPAMAVATDVIIPLQAKPLSFQALAATERNVRTLGERAGRHPRQHLLPTLVRTTRQSRNLLSGLRAGRDVLPEVRQAVAMEEAAGRGLLPADYDPQANPMQDYADVATALLKTWAEE